MSLAKSLLLEKKILRNELKQKLKNMTKENRNRQSQIILQKLLKHQKFQECHRISIYLSRDIEVCTDEILKYLFKWGKECFVPKYDSAKPFMEMVKLKSMDDFENLPLTAWNIKQPADSDCFREEALSTGGLDLMIVPGIGFTRDGHRIGNGKGYYDLYMKKCYESTSNKLFTIGLAFKEQIVDSIPTDQHDIIIDEIICPE